MTSKLKASQRQNWDEVAKVQTISSGIEAAVKRQCPGQQGLGQFAWVGALGDQPALSQIVKKRCRHRQEIAIRQ